MSDLSLHPLRFQPVYKDYLWGGHRIAERYGRDTGGDICAESWEIADRDDGMSVVAEGPFAGVRFRELMEQRARDILGPKAVPGQRFPLLVKILDASSDLSVQVHPNDETAARTGGEAKSEMWYILGADPGAMVYRGFVEGVDREVFERALGSGWLERLLVKWRVSERDAVYVPGGTVHAIGAGCLILEIQQNSNTTYRVFDWDRTGPDGAPRELHTEQAAEVLHWEARLEPPSGPRLDTVGEGWMLEAVLETPYFRVDRLTVSRVHPCKPDWPGCGIVFVEAGWGAITSDGFTAVLRPGDTWLIPACLQSCDVRADSEEEPLALVCARPAP